MLEYSPKEYTHSANNKALRFRCVWRLGFGLGFGGPGLQIPSVAVAARDLGTAEEAIPTYGLCEGAYGV